MATYKRSASLAATVALAMFPLVELVRREAVYRLREHQIVTAVPKYPEVIVPLPHGSPEYIIRAVCQAMDQAGVPRREIAMFIEDALSEDYPHLLVTVARWVKVP